MSEEKKKRKRRYIPDGELINHYPKERVDEIIEQRKLNRRLKKVKQSMDPVIYKGIANLRKTNRYQPEMCRRLIKLFSERKTRAHFCAQENITPATFHIYLEKYPEFKEAYEIAKAVREASYWDLGEKAMMGEVDGFNANIYKMFSSKILVDGFNANIYKMFSSKIFPWAESEQKRAGDTNNTTNNINVNMLQGLSNEELQQRITNKLNAIKGGLTDASKPSGVAKLDEPVVIDHDEEAT